MKLIIAGTRTLSDYNWVLKAISYAEGCDPALVRSEITEVVHGAARGIDTTAGIWAQNSGIAVKEFPAKWDDVKAPGAVVRTGKYGPYNAKAGFDRNVEMAKYGTALLAVIQGGSKGTTHMIETAKQHGLQVWVYEV